MTDVYALLAAAVSPVPVYRLHAPQQGDAQPNPVPYVVFSADRSNAGMDTFCGPFDEMTEGYIVDCFDSSYAGALDLDRQITAVFDGLLATHEATFEDWEPDTRVYRISSSFTLMP